VSDLPPDPEGAGLTVSRSAADHRVDSSQRVNAVGEDTDEIGRPHVRALLPSGPLSRLETSSALALGCGDARCRRLDLPSASLVELGSGSDRREIHEGAPLDLRIYRGAEKRPDADHEQHGVTSASGMASEPKLYRISYGGRKVSSAGTSGSSS
jgi:hypothetical protein